MLNYSVAELRGNTASDIMERYNLGKLLNYIEKLLEYLFKSSDKH